MVRWWVMLHCFCWCVASPLLPEYILDADIKKELENSNPVQLQRMRIQADQGIEASQYQLGLAYLYGANGIHKDLNEARLWFKKAALQGSSRAQTNLGILYSMETTNLNEAQSWFKQAIQRDDSNIDAKWMLGRLLYDAMELDSAAHWFQEASNQGSVKGHFYLGIMYEYGLGGLPVDFRKSLQLYTAASSGDSNARYYAGLQILYGRGTKQDFTVAGRMISSAAHAGIPEAMLTLGKLFTHGQGVEMDYRLALGWFARVMQYASEGSEVYQRALASQLELQSLVDMSDTKMFEKIKSYL